MMNGIICINKIERRKFMEEKIIFNCPNCEKLLKANTASKNKKGQCPVCNNLLRVPEESTTAGWLPLSPPGLSQLPPPSSWVPAWSASHNGPGRMQAFFSGWTMTAIRRDPNLSTGPGRLLPARRSSNPRPSCHWTSSMMSLRNGSLYGAATERF